MGSNPTIPRLDHTITACWICRRFLRKGTSRGLCRVCQKNASKVTGDANNMSTGKLTPAQLIAREHVITEHRRRVGAEMEAIGQLPPGWHDKPIPKCCLVYFEQLHRDKFASQLDAGQHDRDQGDRFDRIRRRDVERALANAALAEFLAWGQEVSSGPRIQAAPPAAAATSSPLAGGVPERAAS